MHPKVAAAIQQVAGFERVLEALAQELIDSTDDELLEAAKELGMDPTMRGSAAFIGLKYPSMPRISDFFELPALLPQRIGIESNPMALSRAKRRLSSRRKRRRPPGRGSEFDAE